MPADEFEFERFEWDEAKNGANIAKHGISFADATRVFADANCYAYRSRYRDEVRDVAIGALPERLVAVVFTRRGINIRIISARAARRSERELYEKELSGRHR